MEKLAGGSKESEVRAGRKQKDGLAELRKAVDDCREIIWGYGSGSPSEVLLGKLSLLERELLDEFFKAVPSEKGSARVRKKEKQAVPAPKVGA